MCFAFVCYGKMQDYLDLKTLIKKEFPDVKINFTTTAPEYLYILKKSLITPEQLEKFQDMLNEKIEAEENVKKV